MNKLYSVLFIVLLGTLVWQSKADIGNDAEPPIPLEYLEQFRAVRDLSAIGNPSDIEKRWIGPKYGVNGRARYNNWMKNGRRDRVEAPLKVPSRG